MRRFLETGAGELPKKAIITDDPMRVKMLAAHYLNDSRIVSENRGMTAFSGNYGGKPLCLISTGFGESALVNWLTEAINSGVREVVYIGECVALRAELKLRDIIVPRVAYGESGEETPSDNMLRKALSKAAFLGIRVYDTPVYTDGDYWLRSDLALPGSPCAVDFAAGALFRYASRNGVEALAALTVSEHALTGDRVDGAERQSRFYNAARLAIETL
ncbi:MAG: hypothetical protein LBS84_03040 [Clostridiales bacterium]|nr:hypothetical protein [Clostridiales bacterium]